MGKDHFLWSTHDFIERSLHDLFCSHILLLCCNKIKILCLFDVNIRIWLVVILFVGFTNLLMNVLIDGFLSSPIIQASQPVEFWNTCFRILILSFILGQTTAQWKESSFKSSNPPGYFGPESQCLGRHQPLVHTSGYG